MTCGLRAPPFDNELLQLCDLIRRQGGISDIQGKGFQALIRIQQRRRTIAKRLLPRASSITIRLKVAKTTISAALTTGLGPLAMV